MEPIEQTKTSGDSEKSNPETSGDSHGNPKTPGDSAKNPGTGVKRLSGAARRKLKRVRRAAESKVLEGGPEQPSKLPEVKKTEASKRRRSDESTPNRETKRPKHGSPKDATRSFKEAIEGQKMAIIHQDMEGHLTEEDTGKLKTWIIQRIDSMGEEEGKVYPRFTEARYRAGALHIVCSDAASRGWLGRQLEQAVPWEGARLRLVEAKNLPKPVRAMVWIPGPQEEPGAIIKRIGRQNPVDTKRWTVVDRKDDPKGQQLVVLMDQKSWDHLGSVCQHRPYVNLTRIQFKLLGKKQQEEGQEKMEVEGPQAEATPPTTSNQDD